MKTIDAMLRLLVMSALVAGCTPSNPQVEAERHKSATSESLRAVDPKVRIDWDQQSGRLFVSGSLSEAMEAPAQTIARDFLSRHRLPLGPAELDDLLVYRKTQELRSGWRHVTFAQRYQGVTVWGRELKVHVDPDGRVALVNGEFLPARVRLDTTASVPAGRALTLARADAGGDATAAPLQDPELIVFEYKNAFHLAWNLTLAGAENGERAEWVYFVDAHTAEILRRYNDIDYQATSAAGADCLGDSLTLQVMQSDNGDFLLEDETRVANGGARITTRDKGSTSKDNDGNWESQDQRPEANVHFWLGESYDFLKASTGREGYDGNGHRVVAGPDPQIWRWHRRQA